MSVSRHLKQTPEDMAIMARLSDAITRQMERFAQRFNEERVTGTAYSDGQKAVTAAAKLQGFLIKDVISCARDAREGRSFQCIVVLGGRYDVVREVSDEKS